MNTFKTKIKKMEDKLAYLEFYYGYNNIKACDLRDKLKIYKEVDKMSREEIGNQLTRTAGEIEKLKSGYYYYATSVDDERKLLNVLREKIKSDKKDKTKEMHGDLVEFGGSSDGYGGGFEF